MGLMIVLCINVFNFFHGSMHESMHISAFGFQLCDVLINHFLTQLFAEIITLSKIILIAMISYF